MRRAFLAIVLTISLSSPFMGCGQGPGSKEKLLPGPPPKNSRAAHLPPPVILISCDTLRADHLGCYGYERNTTPNLDAFARDAVLFANAFTPEVWTLTAHMTMLTGLNPEQHGLTPNLNLFATIPTLPERLQAAGYATGGFVGHAWWLKGSRGFARGFDRYDAPEDYRPISETHRLAVESWLVNQSGKPVFLFLHNYDLHSKPKPEPTPPGPAPPYDSMREGGRPFTAGVPVPPFMRPGQPDALATLFLAAHNAGELEVTPEEQDYLVRAYDDCVFHVDDELGGLFSVLRAIPYQTGTSFYDSALIVVTADHGESLGDHNQQIHGNVYEENVHVPLLVKFPGQAHGGAVVDGMVGLADLAPTILDVLQLPPLAKSDGISLREAAVGAPLPVRTFYLRRGAWRAVRTPQFKLLREIGSGFSAGFDLLADPREQAPLPQEGAFPALARALNAYYFPPQTGWQISFTDTTGDLRVAFTVTSAAELVAVQAATGHFVEETRSLDGARHVAGGMFQFTPAYTGDTLAVRTEPPGAPVTVTLEANHPMVNGLAPEAAPNTALTLELDQTGLASEGSGELRGPAVGATYRAEGDPAESATMDADETAALEALGYLEGGSK